MTDGQSQTDDGVVEREHLCDISNEYGLVKVNRIVTPNGERLELVAPRFDHTIRLDAVELEGISWQDHDAISEFLKEPHGPESTE